MFFYPNLAYSLEGADQHVTFRALFREVLASIRQARAQRRAGALAASRAA